MSSVERLSALSAQRQDGSFGAHARESPGVVLEELKPAALAQINGAPDEETLGRLLDLDEILRPRRAALGKTYDTIWNGPGKWLSVSTEREPAAFVAELRSRLKASDATVTDLSHARTIVRISGNRVCDVLCKGCPADLEGLSNGDAVATQIGSLSTLIHCREAGAVFDLYVFRSFGQSFWEWLTDAALEYGYTVGGEV